MVPFTTLEAFKRGRNELYWVPVDDDDDACKRRLRVFAFGCGTNAVERSMGMVTVNTVGFSMVVVADCCMGEIDTENARLTGRSVVCPLSMMPMSTVALMLALTAAAAAADAVMFLSRGSTLESGGGGGYLPMYRGSVLNVTVVGALKPPGWMLSSGSADPGGKTGTYRSVTMKLDALAGTSTLLDVW